MRLEQEETVMHGSYDDFSRSQAGRGPAMFLGYCGRTRQYRMMDLPEYLSNVQEGVSRWASDASTMYQEITRGYERQGRGSGGRGVRARADHECGCSGTDCHCECCVCDADVLVHARCNEIRRIPVTFDNETRRERPVKLVLEQFVTAGGRPLGWDAKLSETEFTLRPCGEHTVSILVQVRCDTFGGEKPTGEKPTGEKPGGNQPTGATVDRPSVSSATNTRLGSVDRCEVAYATLRADGCLIRPIVVAVAVLPDDCDAYRRPCACGCCH
jgi:hypothetical protein